MSSLKLTYYPVPARAEPIRLALTLGGIPFDDNRINGATWASMAEAYAPRQLPILAVDGTEHTQAIALLRYACKLAKYNGQPLYPSDPAEALLVDEVVDQVCETYGPFMESWFEKDPQVKAEARSKVFAVGGRVEVWAALIDATLAASESGFAACGRLTMADVAIFCIFGMYRAGFLDGVPQTCFDHLPHVMAHRNKIASLPVVRDYYKDKSGPYACMHPDA